MIQINRNKDNGQYKISDVFPDISRNPILLELFETSQEAEDVLSHTKENQSEAARLLGINRLTLRKKLNY